MAKYTITYITAAADESVEADYYEQKDGWIEFIRSVQDGRGSTLQVLRLRDGEVERITLTE